MSELTDLQLNHSAKTHTITLVEGDKTHSLIFEKQEEFNRWGEALAMSIKTAAEVKISQQNAATGIARITRLFERNKTKALEEIEEQFVTPLNHTWTDVGALLGKCSELRRELIEIVEECLKSEPVRSDIVAHYMSTAHAAIVEALSDFWEIKLTEKANGYYKLDEEGLLLVLVRWCIEYREQLRAVRVVDEALQDVESVITQNLERMFHAMKQAK